MVQETVQLQSKEGERRRKKKRKKKRERDRKNSGGKRVEDKKKTMTWKAKLGRKRAERIIQ